MGVVNTFFNSLTIIKDITQLMFTFSCNQNELFNNIQNIMNKKEKKNKNFIHYYHKSSYGYIANEKACGKTVIHVYHKKHEENFYQ
jgi:hypothetical protein